MIVHEKTDNRTSWGYHVTLGWYIGPSLENYRCMQCYMPATSIVRITYTLRCILKGISFQKTTTEDYLHKAIEDIISIMKDSPKTLPFLSYGGATKNLINQISHIFQKITFQPRLQILPLPLMLPQTQSENIQHQNIPSIPVPAPRVKPISQPLRVQTDQSAHTPPSRDQPSTPPRLDPHPNPWIKTFQNIVRHPRSSNQEKTGDIPEILTPLTPIPVQLWTKCLHPSRTVPCYQSSIQLHACFPHLQ